MSVNRIPTSLNSRQSAAGGQPVSIGAVPAEAARHKDLVQNAQKWAAQTFFGPILKQMRNSPFKSELFSGGKQAEAFHELYDQRLAERMARSTGRGLAESIAKHIERHRAGPTPAEMGAQSLERGSTRISPAVSVDDEGRGYVQAA
jgi:Rod binding domain-containing protein